MSNALKKAISAPFQQERTENREKGLQYMAGIVTRVPSKWRLIDLETGQVYGVQADPENPYNWKKVNDLDYEVKQ